MKTLDKATIEQIKAEVLETAYYVAENMHQGYRYSPYAFEESEITIGEETFYLYVGPTNGEIFFSDENDKNYFLYASTNTTTDSPVLLTAEEGKELSDKFDALVNKYLDEFEQDDWAAQDQADHEAYLWCNR